MLANSGQDTGIICAVAFNFMVQEPNEIMEWFNARSLFSSFLIYEYVYLQNIKLKSIFDCFPRPFKIKFIWSELEITLVSSSDTFLTAESGKQEVPLKRYRSFSLNYFIDF